ncbi:MAG: hypothetical protein U0167_08875 [bacterium]
MARTPEKDAATRGSQKWLQILVNDRPDILARELSKATGGAIRGSVTWCSPLRDDAFAEYRDQAFLDLLEIRLRKRSLADFWPAGGPHWDGLGRAGKNVILVEAKAHVSEVPSDCGAGPGSLARIRQSFAEVQSRYGAKPGRDWTKGYYQHANRLAHLCLLREFNRIAAWLVDVYVTGDEEMHGPKNRAEWKRETAKIHRALGLPAQIPGAVDVYVDASEIAAVSAPR